MKKTLVPLLMFILFLSSCKPVTDEIPATATEAQALPTDVPVSPTDTPTLQPETKALVISFDPNPVIPYQSAQGTWVWAFTFNVHNPNAFPVEIIAFGDFGQCLTDGTDCAHTGTEFEEWFTGCGEGSTVIPAQGDACDRNWWIESDFLPPADFSGQYAVYFRDENNEVRGSLSELLTLQTP